MKWFFKALKNYFKFSGRARRKEYWYFTLFNGIFSMFLSLLITLTLKDLPHIILVYLIFVMIPTLSVTVRRMHDIGKSGWWLLINFVPVVGGIILLVLACLDSQPVENVYGANPKDME